MDGQWLHGYKTKISRIDGISYFLNNGAPRARTPLLVFYSVYGMFSSQKRAYSTILNHIYLAAHSSLAMNSLGVLIIVSRFRYEVTNVF